MDKNENSLTQDISEIKDKLKNSLNNIKFIKELYNPEKQDSLYDIEFDDIKLRQKSKSRKITTFRVTYFIPVLQFLDIKSLIEFSKVNHLFYSFIYSFYFYRSVNQIIVYSLKNSKNKNNDMFDKNNMKRIKSNNSGKNSEQSSILDEGLILGPTKKIYSSFMSSLAGALNYINPVGEVIPTMHKEKNELEEIQKKINLHEKLLDERFKQVKISNEIKETRAELDKYIKEQYDIKNKQKKNELNKKTSNKINDLTIKKLKREKYESEYKALIQEINEYEAKYNDLKKENEIQSKIGVDLETKINKIKNFAKNVFKSEQEPK